MIFKTFIYLKQISKVDVNIGFYIHLLIYNDEDYARKNILWNSLAVLIQRLLSARFHVNANGSRLRLCIFFYLCSFCKCKINIWNFEVLPYCAKTSLVRTGTVTFCTVPVTSNEEYSSFVKTGTHSNRFVTCFCQDWEHLRSRFCLESSFEKS